MVVKKVIVEIDTSVFLKDFGMDKEKIRIIIIRISDTSLLRLTETGNITFSLHMIIMNPSWDSLKVPAQGSKEQ